MTARELVWALKRMLRRRKKDEDFEICIWDGKRSDLLFNVQLAKLRKSKRNDTVVLITDDAFRSMENGKVQFYPKDPNRLSPEEEERWKVHLHEEMDKFCKEKGLNLTEIAERHDEIKESLEDDLATLREYSVHTSKLLDDMEKGMYGPFTVERTWAELPLEFRERLTGLILERLPELSPILNKILETW
jgi:hypothetical protein